MEMGCVILLKHTDTHFSLLSGSFIHLIHLIFCSFSAAFCYYFLEARFELKQTKLSFLWLSWCCFTDISCR